MAEMHGGELVVRQLKNEGVEMAFGLVGGHIAHVNEASDRLGMQILDVRHEAAAAHMAEAYGRITRRPGVCLVTAGPGFTNALTGIQNARMAGSPMVVISGRAGISQEHKLALQDMNQIDIVRPMTKWATTVHQAHRIPEFISMAFRHAVEGSPGPVYLEIPFELLVNKIPADDVPFPENNLHLRTAVCDEGAVEEALEMLRGAERPVIVAGSGAYYARPAEPLAALVEKTAVPLFTLNMARGLVPDSHPACFGNAMTFTIGAASVGMPNADVMLLLGTRVSMFLNFGRPPQMHPDCRVIQVDIDPTEIGRNRDVALGIHGDAGSFCVRALEILERKPKPFSTGPWVQTLKDDLPRIRADQEPFLEDQRPVCHPLRLCAEVDRFLGDEGILIADGGDTQAWMPMIRRFNREGGYMDTGLFGCLGVGIPFGIAAKALRPGETVVVFNGDGSMGFNMMEFDTAVRHRLPIIIVVNNDLAWGMIKHGNELTFGRDNQQGSELGLVRYDRIAEAMGGYGELVRDPAGIAGALQRAQSQNVPSCINVLTDTTAVSPGTVGLTMLFAQSLLDFTKA